MKEEEKYLQSLFEQARNEEPQLSYEEVSHNLEVALNPEKIFILKDWFFNHIYLNTFIAILFISSGFLFLNSQSNEAKLATASLLLDESQTPIEAKSILTVIEKKQTELEDEEKITPKIKLEKIQIKNAVKPSQKITKQVSSIDKTVTLSNVITTTAKKIPKAIHKQKPSKANSTATKKPETVKKALPKQTIHKQDNRSELEVFLETALNTEKLKEDLFLKNRNGDFQQLIIKTNNKFDNLIDVDFAGKKSIIISSRYSGSFNIVDDKFLDIQSLKIQEDKAILEFIYNSEFIQVELERIDDIWVHKYTNKTYAQADHFVRQELLQMLLDTEEMAEVIERNTNGNSKPFKLLSDGLISNLLKVNFEGEELEIVPYPNSLRVTYAKITKFKVKKKKAIIEFTCQGKTNAVDFKNKNGDWSIHSFKQI